MRSFVIPPVVSIVIPVFNEEAVLPELFKRLTAVFDQDSDITWCALLVNDGSVDRTAELVRERFHWTTAGKHFEQTLLRNRSPESATIQLRGSETVT